MRWSGLVTALAVTAFIFASSVACGQHLSALEKQNLYKWLIRMDKDLAELNAAYSREIEAGEKDTLGDSVIEHCSEGLNHWRLAPVFRSGLTASLMCIEPHLAKLDTFRVGVQVDGNAKRFSDLSKAIKELTGRLEGDWWGPTHKERGKALDHVQERLDPARKIVAAVKDAVRASVPDVDTVERLEGLKVEAEKNRPAAAGDPTFGKLEEAD